MRKIVDKSKAEKKAEPAAVPAVPRVSAMKTHDLMSDTFNVIHCRVALNDGVPEAGDWGLVREKLLQIIGMYGWEHTLLTLASCARLFAEVPSPLPPLTNYSQGLLHAIAAKLDAEAITKMRHVDKDATKGHRI